MLPQTPPGDAVLALTNAVIYFGFITAFGVTARAICRRLMRHYGVDLADVHEQAGTERRERDVFLPGAWRKEK